MLASSYLHHKAEPREHSATVGAGKETGSERVSRAVRVM